VQCLALAVFGGDEGVNLVVRGGFTALVWVRQRRRRVGVCEPRNSVDPPRVFAFPVWLSHRLFLSLKFKRLPSGLPGLGDHHGSFSSIFPAGLPAMSVQRCSCVHIDPSGRTSIHFCRNRRRRSHTRASPTHVKAQVPPSPVPHHMVSVRIRPTVHRLPLLWLDAFLHT
jgi:hypothetical protein